MFGLWGAKPQISETLASRILQAIQEQELAEGGWRPWWCLCQYPVGTLIQVWRPGHGSPQVMMSEDGHRKKYIFGSYFRLTGIAREQLPDGLELCQDSYYSYPNMLLGLAERL